jgi:hypothetical protein
MIKEEIQTTGASFDLCNEVVDEKFVKEEKTVPQEICLMLHQHSK